MFNSVETGVVVVLLNLAAGIGGFWFYSLFEDMIETFEWYNRRLGLIWFVQLVLLGAGLATYVMLSWSLGLKNVGIWLILICPPLFFIFAGVLFATIIAAIWFGVFALSAAWSATRRIAPIIAAVTCCFVVPPILESYWDSEMCRSAIDLGLTDIQRPSFLFNVSRIGSKFGREPYAIAFDGEAYWDWGYEQMDFVPFQAKYPRFSDTSRFEPLACE